METRVALIGILIDDPDAVEKVNQILHQSSRWIVGRMGIPYHARNIQHHQCRRRCSPRRNQQDERTHRETVRCDRKDCLRKAP